MDFSVEQVFAYNQELRTKEYCMGTRIDFSTEMKLHFLASATMTCLERTDYAALERSGITAYQIQNVKVSLFLRVYCLS